MLWIAVAAQLMAPQPLNLDYWFTSNDVPIPMLRENWLYVVVFSLTVTPDGRNVRCEVESSSGFQKLDSRTCSLAMKRARFRPAIAGNGRPIYGVYRTFAHWVVTSGDTPPTLPAVGGPSLQLKVGRLPEGLKYPANVQVMFAVDTAGALSNCMLDPASKEPKANDVMGPVACDQLAKNFAPAPAKDESGKAVSSVQTAMVRCVKP
jgi:Gram-negative bacterial TonB protein C-terminal